MKLHEYQAKGLLASEGVAVPPGFAAETVEEAVAAAEKLGGNFWVVKAQVHAGGRGKGRFQGVASQEDLNKVVQGIPVEGGIGGVALCKTMEQVREAAEAMLGNVLVTKQTGLAGVQVNTIYVTVGADIDREIYAAVLLDRQESKIVLMCSAEGGTEIEEVVEENPDAILKAYVEEGRSRADIIAMGYEADVVNDMVRKVDLNEYKRKQAAPGLKITPLAFGVGRRIPIVQKYVH